MAAAARSAPWSLSPASTAAVAAAAALAQRKQASSFNLDLHPSLLLDDGALAAAPVRGVRLDTAPTPSVSPQLQAKTTARGVYAAARARVGLFPRADSDPRDALG